MTDKRALGILTKTYWDQGWRYLAPSDEDYRYAVSAGLMFRPLVRGHKDIVSSVRRLVEQVRLIDVSNAFLASLSTRRLDLRSALGSYACALNLPVHTYRGAVGCQVCGLYGDRPEERDLNVLSFERHKWGGTRHLGPLYMAFDLEQFVSSDKVEPTSEDLAIMDRMIGAAEALPLSGRASDLEKALGGIVESNKAERRTLIEILGYCGILETAEFSGPASRFMNAVDRPFPPTIRNDWNYPVSWWKRSEGVNWAALRRFFPQMDVHTPEPA